MGKQVVYTVLVVLVSFSATAFAKTCRCHIDALGGSDSGRTVYYDRNCRTSEVTKTISGEDCRTAQQGEVFPNYMYSSDSGREECSSTGIRHLYEICR